MVIGLDIKLRTIKFLEVCIGEYLQDLEIGQVFGLDTKSMNTKRGKKNK